MLHNTITNSINEKNTNSTTTNNKTTDNNTTDNKTNKDLTLFCLVDGDSTPFSVDIDASKTVDHLKDAIKLKKPNDFNDIDADKLTLWHVSIPILRPKERKSIFLSVGRCERGLQRKKYVR
ncbi:hypothetical protein BGX26_007146 [Mortierella sp. AD094]|nr:hypothetical protein BGX26_007146 [Mortierella sp. AD094]